MTELFPRLNLSRYRFVSKTPILHFCLTTSTARSNQERKDLRSPDDYRMEVRGRLNEDSQVPLAGQAGTGAETVARRFTL